MIGLRPCGRGRAGVVSELATNGASTLRGRSCWTWNQRAPC